MKRYLRERFKAILKLDDPPHKLALAFALGVFIAFSPWIGLHIASCFLFAWIFRVSKFVVLTGQFVNNPWTAVPIYGFCLWFGVKITGSDVIIPEIAWKELGVSDIFTILHPFLWPFVVGAIVAGIISAIVAYIAIYWAVVKYRKLNEMTIY